MLPLCQLEIRVSEFWCQGVTIPLTDDRQLMRLERLAELSDEDRGANTRVRSRRAA